MWIKVMIFFYRVERKQTALIEVNEIYMTTCCFFFNCIGNQCIDSSIGQPRQRKKFRETKPGSKIRERGTINR